jgi:hypothetical protein
MLQDSKVLLSADAVDVQLAAASTTDRNRVVRSSSKYGCHG